MGARHVRIFSHVRARAPFKRRFPRSKEKKLPDLIAPHFFFVQRSSQFRASVHTLTTPCAINAPFVDLNSKRGSEILLLDLTRTH